MFFFFFSNEVWRFEHYPGFFANFRMSALRGFKYAAAAMLLTIAADKAFGLNIGGHGHGDHDDHH